MNDRDTEGSDVTPPAVMTGREMSGRCHLRPLSEVSSAAKPGARAQIEGVMCNEVILKTYVQMLRGLEPDRFGQA
jgi:hypothetical protein